MNDHSWMSDQPIELDWTETSKTEGVRDCTITKVEQSRSQGKGERMLVVTFESDLGKLSERIMLEGNGREFGIGKLKALGVEPGKPFEPSKLVGLRVEVAVKMNGDYLNVDSGYKGEGFKKGYRVLGGAPPPPPIDENAPF